jgi:HEAT repeat protein
VFHALARIGVPAVRPVLDAADSITGNATWGAAEALRSIGKDAIPILREGLGSKNANTRRLAADVLARLPAEPDTDSVAGIVESLWSKDPTYRRRAIEAVGRLGPAAAAALPALLDLIRDEQASDDRTLAAWAVGQLGPAAVSAVPELLRLVGRKDSFLPAGLLYSLAQIGHGPSGIVILLNASRRLRANEYDWVCQNLHNASLRGPSAPPGDERVALREVILPAYRERTRSSTLTEPAHIALSKSPARAVAAIRPFLSDESHETRIVAVWALRHVGTPEAAAEVLTAMKDKDQLVRLQAVRALGRIGRGVTGAAEAVRAACKDRAKEVRAAAEEALKALSE